jgi:PAP2 superfamily
VGETGTVRHCGRICRRGQAVTVQCAAGDRHDETAGASAAIERADEPDVIAAAGVQTTGIVADHSPSSRLTGLFTRSWMIELAVLLALAFVYNSIRAMSGTSESIALTHARDILAAEGGLFDSFEVPLNTWLTGVPVVAVAACYFYALMHYAATPVVLIVSRRRGTSRYWRAYWSLMLASGIALAVYALYPAAPPRLVPGLDIVDVMRRFADYGWWGSAASAPRGIGDATNQFAAMPSMHFGWALWCSIQMWGFGGRIWRALAGLYPPVLIVVVVATGNHFLLDIAGGAACVIGAYAIVALVSARIDGSNNRPTPAPADAAGPRWGRQELSRQRTAPSPTSYGRWRVRSSHARRCS